jgi:signal transduction histidine kinase
VIFSFSHELFARFYYLPIILAGWIFGLRGGMGAAFLVTVLYLPHVVAGWGGRTEEVLDKLLEVVLFNLSGATVGFLADRERRQRARAQELQTLAALGEAAASVAHEMKNAVIPIRGFLRRLRKEAPPEGKAVSYLEVIERAAGRLEGMIRDMLSFAGRLEPKREPVEVAKLLEELYEELQEESRQRSVRLICNCSEPGIQAELDPERIRQALHNLLQNAIHASPPGEEVRLSVSPNGRSIRFVVEDKGEGIPPELAERIFTPFFTTKTQGTGLGLPITRRIVEGHGGRMHVESTPGQGTRIIVEVPTELVPAPVEGKAPKPID